MLVSNMNKKSDLPCKIRLEKKSHELHEKITAENSVGN